jgi:hypothetical protein
LERFRNHLTTGNADVKGYAEIGDHKIPIKRDIFSAEDSTTERLLAKYEKYIENGHLTIEEAIDRAFTGRDIEDPMTDLIDRERVVNRLFDNDCPLDQARGPEFATIKRDMAKIFSNVTLEVVDHALESHAYFSVMQKLRDFELSITDHEINAEAWRGLCKAAYSRFGADRKILSKGVPITNPIKYYEEVLKQYVAQSMANTITDMDRSGVFTKYDPQVRPLAVTCYQRHFADLFPNAEIIADMSSLIDNGFVPKNASKMNIFGTELVAYAVFWSLAFNFNLFGAFFRGSGGAYNYHWIVYDRINQDIDEIIGPADDIIMETVVPPNNTKPPTDRNLTVTMKYKEVSSLEADLKAVAEKFGTDDIADICIKSKPGEAQRISIKFKDTASEEEKETLLQYVTDMAKNNMGE